MPGPCPGTISSAVNTDFPVRPWVDTGDPNALRFTSLPGSQVPLKCLITESKILPPGDPSQKKFGSCHSKLQGARLPAWLDPGSAIVSPASHPLPCPPPRLDFIPRQAVPVAYFLPA